MHLENASAELHELTAAAFFKSRTIENPEVLNANRTDLVLQPHERSKDVIFVPHQIRRVDTNWCAPTVTGPASPVSATAANSKAPINIGRLRRPSH
jgi:hypothetical protein